MDVYDPLDAFLESEEVQKSGDRTDVQSGAGSFRLPRKREYDEISEELAKNIYDRKCVYVPYLGKNDHPAIIEEISYVELKEVDDTEVQSLIPSSYIEDELWEYSFKYEEYLPIELKLSTNNYILEKFCFTDCDELYSNEKVWFDGERNVVFF